MISLHLLLVAITFSASHSIEINPKIYLNNVECIVDISSQLVKGECRLSLENNGDKPVNSILYAFEPSFKSHISYVSARQVSESNRLGLTVKPVTVTGHHDKQFYQIDFNASRPLRSKGRTPIVVQYILINALNPHPEEITQKDRQLMMFYGNAFFYSPYKSLKSSIKYQTGTRRVEEYTNLNPVTQSSGDIIYGTHGPLEPFSYSQINIHYDNNSPFLKVTKLTRTIEISHWGNIAVTEVIDLVHHGAKLKGSFSRYDYQRETTNGIASVKSFKMSLPASASSVYYRDVIGNISTSNQRTLLDSVELDIRPRFPLFGGWKTHYTIGYNVPAYEYLSSNGDDYILKMRLIDHLYDNMIIEDVTVCIILPEGSSDVELQTPYPTSRLPDGLHYTYLDTIGRPMLKVQMSNVVESHIKDFELKYKFPKVFMFHEPLIVIAAIFILFLTVIIWVRLDFSIAKDEHSETRQRVSGLVNAIIQHVEKRASVYASWEDSLNKLKHSKDVNAYNAVIKLIQADYKNESSSINELANKLKGESNELADKLNEAQKVEKNLKDIFGQVQSLYVDKLIPGKVGRNQFVDTDNGLKRKKDELQEKINQLLKSFY
ncbi:dolichyl-diphosphooligosaccharide--protein glycosyltransferase subunit 1 [Adelges cooleyi]|uniref:dolichyl-diphosphooligosaccharide--protein glycosyltransferase subunit 1 n=1 Tax=Adelges cooleyi TaxID=133065 RepID=UPI00217F858E|nr:dolichyl-diphosphooligosaccharide--protein glycosyltransferase subunit 1 [Adelges cooleyi]